MTARIIVAGSRNFCNWSLLSKVVARYIDDLETDDIEIVSGGCVGADKLGERFADDYMLDCKVFKADWSRYGKSAGPRRNKEMAVYAAEADFGMLIAFPIGESRGTRNMINLANEYGLIVRVIEN